MEIPIRWQRHEYTCENGSYIALVIPSTATQNDLLGFREMIDVILKRTYKVKEKEDADTSNQDQR